MRNAVGVRNVTRTVGAPRLVTSKARASWRTDGSVATIVPDCFKGSPAGSLDLGSEALAGEASVLHLRPAPGSSTDMRNIAAATDVTAAEIAVRSQTFKMPPLRSDAAT